MNDNTLGLRGRSVPDFHGYFASLISVDNVQSYLSMLDFSIYEHYRRVVTGDSRYESDRSEMRQIFGPEKWDLLCESLKKPYPVLVAICERRRNSEPIRRDDFSDVDIAEMAFRVVNEKNVFAIYELLAPDAKKTFDAVLGYPIEALGDQKLDIVEASKVYRASKNPSST
ncbi:hypothetical protein [Lysobacter capsici]|uniref:hypothetical protein n=1 Tax=Lysobacter capsici TaxID=435897 RepID=UPI00287BABB7|nr:hypothetical protein [Lysobacter capsici]WND82010.1 hypothetical protein RJ610_06520 [Lysobacter capsici]WND87206.1 hypothetical protein RJ609_06525 [Lysobacter capsici]